MIAARFTVRHERSNSAALDVDIELPATGVSAVFGRSGAGKTTLLRCIAGLERSTDGRLRVNEQIWQDGSRFLPVHQRRVAYVFQEPRLFPHLSVAGNLRFGQKFHNNPGFAEAEVIELLDIQSLLQRNIAGLSGGEQQRIAIARALLSQPNVLLMDEPLSSLDGPRKKELLQYLERVKLRLNLPIIYVSHSLDEVSRLADHLIVLEQGELLASGNPVDVINSLRLGETFDLDDRVLLDAKVLATDDKLKLATLDLSGFVLLVRANDLDVGDAVRIQVCARDVSLALSAASDSSILNIIPARVSDIVSQEQTGAATVQLAMANEKCLHSLITMKSLQKLELKVGDTVWAQIKSVALVQ